MKLFQKLFQALRDDPNAQYVNRHLDEAVRSGVHLVGNWTFEQHRGGQLIAIDTPPPNLFTTEGMSYLLNMVFHTVSKAASQIWYVGLFKNNATPALDNTAAAQLGAAGTYGECQDADYTPATNRPLYNSASTITSVMTNAANKAQFTAAQGFTAYGAFLTNTAAKTDTSGKLMASKKFTQSRAVIAADELFVTYQITLQSS